MVAILEKRCLIIIIINIIILNNMNQIELIKAF